MIAKVDAKSAFIASLCMLAWITAVAVIYEFVNTYGSPLPYADEWGNVPQAVGQSPITWKWLWSLHNEHRLPLHRLVYVAIIRASGNDFRSGMFFNVFALSGIALILLLFVRKLRGRFSSTDIFIPLSLIGYAHYENLLWSNQIQFILTALLLITIIMLVSSVKETPEFKHLLGIAISLLFLPLCGSSGLIPMIPIFVWFVFWMVVEVYRTRITKKQSLVLIALVMIAIAITGFYFVDYHPVFSFRSFKPMDILRGSMEFLSTSFGPAGIETRKVSSIVCVILILSTLILLASKWNKLSRERFRVSGLIAIIAALCLMTLSVGIGRSGSGGSGAAHRYATLTACLLCAIYVTFTIYAGTRKRNLVLGLLVLLVLLSIPENARIAIEYGKARAASHLKFVQDMQANLPIEALAVRDLEAIFPFYGSFIPDYIRLLEDYKIGPFSSRSVQLPGVEKMPREVEIPLNNESMNPDQNRFVFVFNQTGYVLGFRTSFVILNDLRQPQMYVAWQSPSYNRAIRYPLASSTVEQTYSFWIYDSIKQIQILAPQDHLRISRMTLLLQR